MQTDATNGSQCNHKKRVQKEKNTRCTLMSMRSVQRLCHTSIHHGATTTKRYCRQQCAPCVTSLGPVVSRQ